MCEIMHPLLIRLLPSWPAMHGKPEKLIVELTNHCNLKCKMCGIWAEPRKKIFPLDLFSNILQDPAMKHLRHIALTGGEPFLLPNLEEYYAVARKHAPQAHISISTNGYLTERTMRFLREANQRLLSVFISYDGMKSHDTIRGVEGSARRLLETAQAIRKECPRMALGLKLTITPYNAGEILDTAKQCKSLGIPFRIKTMEKIKCHQNRYPSEISEPDYSDEMVDSIITQAREMLLMGIGTNTSYIRKLIRKYEGRTVKCTCSPAQLFIGVDGDVYLCRRKDSIGNVLRQHISEIWDSSGKEKVVGQMKTCEEWRGRSLSYIYE